MKKIISSKINFNENIQFIYKNLLSKNVIDIKGYHKILLLIDLYTPKEGEVFVLTIEDNELSLKIGNKKIDIYKEILKL